VSKLKKDTLEETEYFDGEKVMYYPYLTPQPDEYVTPETTRKAIGEDIFGNPIYEYTTNLSEVFNQCCQWWLAAHPATDDTVQVLS